LLLFYERLLPGTQLVNRLEDLGYEVRTVGAVEDLPVVTAAWKPLLVLADLESSRGNVVEAVRRIRQDPGTSHVPVLGFYGGRVGDLMEQAREAGATLVVQDVALVQHLAQWLDQALEVD
jgi:CheY-like chemotaxis protein